MIKGFVSIYEEPLVPITLLLPYKKIFDAVIDTGFNGYLSIPMRLVNKSKWEFLGFEEYEIATGEKVNQRVYLGEVIFGEVKQIIYAVTSRSNDILIGTKIFKDKILRIDFKKKKVEIN